MHINFEKSFSIIHMNTWIVGKDLMKPHFQTKNVFYSELYLEDITDEDYLHAQKVSRRAQEELKFEKVNIMIYMFKVLHNCI